MEKPTKPQDLFIGRNRLLTAVAMIAFFALGIASAVVAPLAAAESAAEDGQIKIMLIIALSILCAICILYGVLNLRNLFFPYILTADEKGIYNYSGLFHYGFIEWKDIQSFAKNSTILDVLDSEQPCLRIYVKDFKKYKSEIPFFKKMILVFGGGNLRIYTLCSQIKKKEFFQLLNNMLSYYNPPEQTVDINE